VDALATLVMVIVFVLMIFTLFQFHLKDMISGRDLALESLSQRIGALADQLSVERRANADLREQVELLSSGLAESIDIRDRLQAELAAADQRIDGIETALAAARDRGAQLAALLASREAQIADLGNRLRANEERAREAEGNVTLTRRQIEDLLAQLTLARDSQRETDGRLRASETRAGELDAALADTQAQLREGEAKATATIADLTRLLTETRGRLEETTRRAETGESGLADLARRIAEIEARLRDSQVRADAEAGRAAGLQRSLAETQAQLQQTRGRAEAGEASAADLARRIAEIEARLRDSQGRADAEAGRAAGLQRSLAETQAQLQQTRGRAEAGEASAADLARRIAEIEARLRESEQKVTLSAQQAVALAARLADAEARARAAEGRVAEADRTLGVDRERIEVQLRELDALRRNVQTLTILRDQLERDLAARGTELRGAGDALAAERKLSSDAQARVDLMTRQMQALQQQLGRLEAALDASEAKSLAQQVQIIDLGRRLNMALASKLEELARYRSEFFGRLREILGDRSDVRVVGDRFIFESEVLFASGSAQLEPEGRRQIESVGAALGEIGRRIPTDINWILQVDGHTDRRPITRGFASNWELSHARAMSVVRALMAGGVPPERLVAAGYAEFHPVDTRDDESAYRRNRRIELKLTEAAPLARTEAPPAPVGAPQVPSPPPPPPPQSPQVRPDPAPAPPPPRPLTTEERRVQYNAAAAATAMSVPCSLLRWDSSDTSVLLAGVAQRGAEPSIQAALRARGVPDPAIRLEIQGFDSAFCPVLDAVRGVAGGVAVPQASVLGSQPLLRGDKLRLDIRMPGFAAYLAVTYLSTDGVATPLLGPRMEQPSARVQLGAGEDWTVDAPFGTDLIVLVATDQRPLPAPRRRSETVQDYAAALTEQIFALRARGARVGVRILAVNTAAQRR
jgi:chemotaxis protein MotB